MSWPIQLMLTLLLVTGCVGFAGTTWKLINLPNTQFLLQIYLTSVVIHLWIGVGLLIAAMWRGEP